MFHNKFTAIVYSLETQAMQLSKSQNTIELVDICGKTWGSHINVADFNTPWHSHKYVETEDECISASKI
jgi:hypothetical protein